MSEEDIILWQDVLDAVLAGRTSALACPFCQRGTIVMTQRERLTRLECPACHKFIEGAFQSQE